MSGFLQSKFVLVATRTVRWRDQLLLRHYVSYVLSADDCSSKGYWQVHSIYPICNAFSVTVYTMTNKLLCSVSKINKILFYSGSIFVAFASAGRNVTFVQELFGR